MRQWMWVLDLVVLLLALLLARWFETRASSYLKSGTSRWPYPSLPHPEDYHPEGEPVRKRASRATGAVFVGLVVYWVIRVIGS